ncbi:MAG: diguanylate cyclase [PVC group bacterium]|nr:diguanylate cyclase [PVC group bacterium]
MKKHKILIVEDNLDDFQKLKIVLEENNYEVKHTATGKETFELLSEEVPDLVILDILLPDTDGFEVCKRIRKDKRFLSLPVLFYSIIRTIDDKLLGLEMGAADFLPKGTNNRELLMRIKNLLKRKEKLDEVLNHPFHDNVTKAFNQEYFQHRLQKECARSKRYNRNLSFAIIDVDKFEMVTNMFGHQTGNCLLKKIAETVQANIRTVDEVCRFGQDQFGVLFPEADLRDAFFSTDRVRQIWATSEIGKQICTMQVTISCGVSAFGKDTVDKNDLVAQTQAALKKAKTEGENRTRSFSKQFGYG